MSSTETITPTPKPVQATAADKHEPAPPGSASALVAAELEMAQPVEAGGPPRDLIGIALSGGGIRSATFNLGLLQGLQDVGLLRAFDYISTVSGGGYLGSFWTAWRHRAAGREGKLPDQVRPGGAEPHEVRHLREFSNFLAPRLGLFSYDTGRMLVTALCSILPSMLAALAVLTVAILLWVVAAGLLLSPAVQHWSFPILVTITVGTLVGFELAWRRRREPDDGSAYAGASLLAVGYTLVAWFFITEGWYGKLAQAGVYAKQSVSEQSVWHSWQNVLAPAAAWGSAFAVMAVGRWLLSTQLDQPRRQRFHRAADRVRSRLLLLTLIWTGMALLWTAGVIVESQYIGKDLKLAPAMGGFTALLAAAFAKIHHLFSRKKVAEGAGKLVALLRPVLPQVLAYAVVGMMALGMVCVIVAGERNGGTVTFEPWQIGVAALGVIALVALLMDPNEVGLHSFYRNRLVRAYPGASNDRGGPNRETEVVQDDDVRINELGGSSARPFHLVCCAANDLASDDAMAGLYRGATSAALSRAGFSVGDAWSPWSEYAAPPTLGGAVTASAAAFNTLMGSKSMQLGPGVTFVAAALNLRLGLWLPHPAGTRRMAKRRFPGWPFLLEMAGQANVTGNHVHLSDGGHFENLAAYELIRRRCRVILVSDCGMDAKADFDDLGNLVRRVREDFGVEIHLDTGPLKPGADGLSRQYMVAGDIHYPGGDTGVLLYFKPVLVGSEPADVAQYRSRNAGFPHESTGDQFYDEAQWESYRRLGLHAAHTAFRAVLDGLRLNQPGRPNEALRPMWMEAFARARREWQPKPEGFDQRLASFADRVAELDGLLRQSGCEFLLQQVYKELDELDRRKLPLPGIPVVGEAAPGQLPAPGEQGGGRVRKHALQVAQTAPGDPSASELSASLYLIRRALLLMEEVFESEGLARNYSHPLYLGVMNWFARWAYAPLFRMWWPLLKTMYPEPFTRFLEKHFSLVSIDRSARETAAGGEQVFTWVERDARGFARTCWLLAGKELPPGRAVLSYNLRMVYERVHQYRIQAAQVIADQAGAALVWDAEDFFVPPGLWGIGIGGDFLATLRDPAHNGLTGVTHLVVRVRTDPAGGPPALKQAADEMQLYRSAGFSHAHRSGDTLVLGNDTIALPAGLMQAGAHETQWMVARVG